MELQTYRVKIKGTRPLLCHNSQQLADPLSEISQKLKEITGVKKKTQDHYKQIADLSWQGSLYLDDANRPIIPTTCLHSMFVAGAKKHKLGKQTASDLEILEHPLIQHDGPRGATAADLSALLRFRDTRLVKVMNSRVTRTRACFPIWVLEFDVRIDSASLKENELKLIIETAGRHIGLGDYRPYFGKYEIESFTKLRT